MNSEAKKQTNPEGSVIYSGTPGDPAEYSARWVAEHGLELNNIYKQKCYFTSLSL